MFDPLLHQPIRSKLISLLISNGELPFKGIKEFLNVTDGNLSSHLSKLESAGYVEIQKSYEGKRPQTIIRIKESGEVAFHNYIECLKKFIEDN